MSDITPIQTCAGIVLAAGSSSRMGMPKQQLEYCGKTLLQHTVDEALLAGLSPLIVVTASVKKSDPCLLQANIIHVVNTHASEGMAASLRCGIQALQQTDAAIVMVCDQPKLHAALLKQLISTQQKNNVAIVASKYKETLGTPALFHNSVFAELLQLQGDRGAKKILDNDAERISTVEFEGGEYDIDTPADYERLNQQQIP